MPLPGAWLLIPPAATRGTWWVVPSKTPNKGDICCVKARTDRERWTFHEPRVLTHFRSVGILQTPPELSKNIPDVSRCPPDASMIPPRCLPDASSVLLKDAWSSEYSFQKNRGWAGKTQINSSGPAWNFGKNVPGFLAGPEKLKTVLLAQLRPLENHFPEFLDRLEKLTTGFNDPAWKCG